MRKKQQGRSHKEYLKEQCQRKNYTYHFTMYSENINPEPTRRVNVPLNGYREESRVQVKAL